MAEKDWKYVFSMSKTDDEVTHLTGPFEDDEAATEYVEDFDALALDNHSHVIMPLDDSDDVLAALKKAKKKAKKRAKKEAKAAKDANANGNGEKAGKQGKGKKAAATATEDDASDAAAPSTEGAAAPSIQEATVAKANEVEIAERERHVYNGRLSEDKDKLIESWSRGMTKHPVIGPLNLTPQQRRVIAALKWCREVLKSNSHMSENPPVAPAPVVGIDANERLVVQGLDGPQGLSGKPRTWAVYKNGDPTDVKEPIKRLKPKVSETV